MKYKKTLLLTLGLFVMSMVAEAQADRVTLLQNARNLLIRTTDNRSYYYLITSEQSQTMLRGNGEVVVGKDRFSVSDISTIRIKALSRFSLDEDSTDISAAYSVDHGLLAFRRSFHLGQWNSLVVPFSLTGQQVREAFGDDAHLAYAKAVTEGDQAILEFETIPLDTDDTVVEAGSFYLLWPTREPDLAEDKQTSVAFGGNKVMGPLYVIPNVSMVSGQKSPANYILRSDDDQLRLRFRGTYKSLTNGNEVFPTSRRLFALDDRGKYCEVVDSLPMKAFRSWMEEARNNTQKELAFYVDGVSDDLMPSGLFAPLVNGIGHQPAEEIYTLQGRKVDRSMLKPGIYVINRKKMVIK